MYRKSGFAERRANVHFTGNDDTTMNKLRRFQKFYSAYDDDANAKPAGWFGVGVWCGVRCVVLGEKTSVWVCLR